MCFCVSALYVCIVLLHTSMSVILPDACAFSLSRCFTHTQRDQTIQMPLSNLLQSTIIPFAGTVHSLANKSTCVCFFLVLCFTAGFFAHTLPCHAFSFTTFPFFHFSHLHVCSLSTPRKFFNNRVHDVDNGHANNFKLVKLRHGHWVQLIQASGKLV